MVVVWSSFAVQIYLYLFFLMRRALWSLPFAIVPLIAWYTRIVHHSQSKHHHSTYKQRWFAFVRHCTRASKFVTREKRQTKHTHTQNASHENGIAHFLCNDFIAPKLAWLRPRENVPSTITLLLVRYAIYTYTFQQSHTRQAARDARLESIGHPARRERSWRLMVGWLDGMLCGGGWSKCVNTSTLRVMRILLHR